MNYKSIGLRIRKAREAKGLTQEQLADMTNLSVPHMSVIERGAKLPRMDTFIEIANALNVTADSLLLDVLNTSSQIMASELSVTIEKMPVKEQKKILSIIQILTDGND